MIHKPCDDTDTGQTEEAHEHTPGVGWWGSLPPVSHSLGALCVWGVRASCIMYINIMTPEVGRIVVFRGVLILQLRKASH